MGERLFFAPEGAGLQGGDHQDRLEVAEHQEHSNIKLKKGPKGGERVHSEFTASE